MEIHTTLQLCLCLLYLLTTVCMPPSTAVGVVCMPPSTAVGVVCMPPSTAVGVVCMPPSTARGCSLYASFNCSWV